MKYLAGLLALSSTAIAADVLFNVIGYPTSDNGTFGVYTNGTVYPLSTNSSTFPLWSAAIPVSNVTDFEYAYAELQNGTVFKAENFTRVLFNNTITLPGSNDTTSNDTATESTLNEFFQRQTTLWTLPHVPYTYEISTVPAPSEAFNENEIATFSLTSSNSTASNSTTSPTNRATEVAANVTDVKFINAKMVYDASNVQIEDDDEKGYYLTFDYSDMNQTFFNSSRVQLKSLDSDPSFIREKVYLDVLTSAGVPAQTGAWVRLFIDNEPKGLFLMVQNIEEPFVKQIIDGGNSTLPLGPLIKMNTYNNDTANLDYLGSNSSDYNTENVYVPLIVTEPTDPLSDLIKFMSQLKDYSNSTVNGTGISYWDESLQLDVYLRNMAVEYLTGATNNYWQNASNYYMYLNPSLVDSANGTTNGTTIAAVNGTNSTGLWQWITNVNSQVLASDNSTTPESYKAWYNFTEAGNSTNSTASDRPLVRKLIIETPDIASKFEDILMTLVSTVFKTEALAPRINQYHEMLLKDVEWDQSLNTNSTGNNTLPGTNNTILGINLAPRENGTLPSGSNDTAVTPILNWVHNMSSFVSEEFNFEIPAGASDRVPAPVVPVVPVPVPTTSASASVSASASTTASVSASESASATAEVTSASATSSAEATSSSMASAATSAASAASSAASAASSAASAATSAESTATETVTTAATVAPTTTATVVPTTTA
ncbi:hypothetical protein BGZ76_000368 [Entomortierella beljakovae]|nr:hypothetical protein BGZ76_000368 [Entomortierella beljakovae]